MNIVILLMVQPLRTRTKSIALRRRRRHCVHTCIGRSIQITHLASDNERIQTKAGSSYKDTKIMKHFINRRTLRNLKLLQDVFYWQQKFPKRYPLKLKMRNFQNKIFKIKEEKRKILVYTADEIPKLQFCKTNQPITRTTCGNFYRSSRKEESTN